MAEREREAQPAQPPDSREGRGARASKCDEVLGMPLIDTTVVHRRWRAGPYARPHLAAASAKAQALCRRRRRRQRRRWHRGATMPSARLSETRGGGEGVGDRGSDGARPVPRTRSPVFRRAQLERCKALHQHHWRTLPGGRPTIQVCEPKWWKKKMQRRRGGRGRGRGRGGGRGTSRGGSQAAFAAVPPSPERIFSRIRSQVSVVRREQLLIDTYESDRLCESSPSSLI